MNDHAGIFIINTNRKKKVVEKKTLTANKDDTFYVTWLFVQPFTISLAPYPSFPSFRNKVFTPAHTVSPAWKLPSLIKQKYECPSCLFPTFVCVWIYQRTQSKESTREEFDVCTRYTIAAAVK